MSLEPSSSPPQKKNPHQKNIIMMYNFNLLGLLFFLFLVAYIMKIQCIPYWIYHLVKWKAIAFKGVTTPIRVCVYAWAKNRDEGKTPGKYSMHTASIQSKMWKVMYKFHNKYLIVYQLTNITNTSNTTHEKGDCSPFINIHKQENSQIESM